MGGRPGWRAPGRGRQPARHHGALSGRRRPLGQQLRATSAGRSGGHLLRGVRCRPHRVRARGLQRRGAHRGQPWHGERLARGRVRPGDGLPQPRQRGGLQPGLRPERRGRGGRSERAGRRHHHRLRGPQRGARADPRVHVGDRRQRSRADRDQSRGRVRGRSSWAAAPPRWRHSRPARSTMPERSSAR